MEDLSKLTKKELLARLESQPKQTNDADIEMRKINRLANASNPNQIPFSQTNDHKNIFLYTPLNKRIGALHPDNAKKVLSDWSARGYQLYTTPRTPEQVEAFKQTDFYKSEHAKHLAERAKRKKQSKKMTVDEMAKSLGVAIKDAVASK